MGSAVFGDDAAAWMKGKTICLVEARALIMLASLMARRKRKNEARVGEARDEGFTEGKGREGGREEERKR